MIEKRKFPRKPVDLSAALIPDGAAEPIAARVRDLAVGGAFLLVAVRPAFGTRVEVRIDFPAPSGPMKLPAIIRWSDEDGVGVQFGLLGARETHAIVAAISQR